MRNHFRVIVKTVICFLLILSLCGCWNRRELDTIAVVMGAAVDKSNDFGEIQITVQVVKPGEIKSKSKDSGGGSEKAYVNLKSTGDTIFGTLRKLPYKSSRKMFFPHNQIIIFSQDVALDGVQKYTDFFSRDPETRQNVQLLIAKGRAEDILDTKSEIEKIPANRIAKMLQAETGATSQTRAIKLGEFTNLLMSKTTSAIAPFIETTEEGDGKSAQIAGTAVFKGDKLIGELDKKESRGLSWVIGKVKSGIIEVQGSGGDKVSMEIIRARSKVTPEIKDNKITMKIRINEEGNIGEQGGTENISKLPEVAALEKKKAGVIEDEIVSAVKRAQELDADVFGFGDSLHKKYPKLWKTLESKWDEVFKEIKIVVDVEAKIRLMGRIILPTVPEKEKK